MDNERKSQTEMIQLSSGLDKTHYGTSGTLTSKDNQKSTDAKQIGSKGCHNNAYQADDE